MNRIQRGLWSGILATGPMTLLMFRLHRALPAAKKSPLPPATLTAEAGQSLGLTQHLSKNRQADLTMINHFGYGAACGVLYSTVPEQLRRHPWITGPIFGAAVWAVSYLGWTPAFGFRASAYKMPKERNALMILVHLAWGACLAFSENEMNNSGNQMLSGTRKAPLAE